MNNNVSEELIRLLEKIDAIIKYLDNSPNLAFELIDYETLKYFHDYNLYFKLFWDNFDHNSASQLLLFLKVVNMQADLSKKYEEFFRKQLNYLLNIIDFEHDSVSTISPVIFSEDRSSEVLDVYNSLCNKKTDKNGRPLYEIVLDRNYHSEEINGKEVPVNFYRFRSDIIYNSHIDTLLGIYKSLLYIFDLVCAVCAYPGELINDIEFDKEELLSSLEKELRQYAKEVGNNVERDLRKIAQNLKTSRNSSLTPDVWGKVMEEEDKLFDMAISDSWGENEDKRLEHISATKNQLIDNYSLLQKIKSTCLDEELFDIRHSVETHNLLTSLNADNLDLFYELVLRRNIIQREMFPDKLKSVYEEWVNSPEDQPRDDSKDISLSEARQSKLDEIIGILQKGKWKEPATIENIELLLNTIFGRDLSLIEENDIAFCEKMWALVESGAGERMVIVPANLAGFFKEENLLQGSPLEISNALFGKTNNQVNNINKGKGTPDNCSKAFIAVIPFIRKYINKIIRQA